MTRRAAVLIGLGVLSTNLLIAFGLRRVGRVLRRGLKFEGRAENVDGLPFLQDVRIQFPPAATSLRFSEDLDHGSLHAVLDCGNGDEAFIAKWYRPIERGRFERLTHDEIVEWWPGQFPGFDTFENPKPTGCRLALLAKRPDSRVCYLYVLMR